MYTSPGGVGNVGVGDEVTVVPRLLLSDEEGSCTLGEGSTSETSVAEKSRQLKIETYMYIVYIHTDASPYVYTCTCT